jgi:type IV secretory pathway VirJ component
MVTRLPSNVRGRIALVALINPQEYADFEFHVKDWLPFGGHRTSHAVIPEVRKLAGTRVLCVYGTDDHDAACSSMDTTAVEVRELRGGHHFDGDYDRLAAVILTGRP